MFNLKKVDFIWINRDQKSFEWFVNLLSLLSMPPEARDATRSMGASSRDLTNHHSI